MSHPNDNDGVAVETIEFAGEFSGSPFDSMESVPVSFAAPGGGSVSGKHARLRVARRLLI
jgi:hypothetical protein